MFKFFTKEKKILENIKIAVNICSNSKIKIEKKIVAILRYEKKNDLYKLNNNYFVWEYFRPYLNRIIENYENQNYIFRNFIDKILNLKRYKNLLYLPLFISKKKVDIIFFGHPRGEIKSNKINDEYIDHLIKKIPSKKKKIIFGHPHITYGTKYNYLEKRFFVHWIYLIIRISTFLKFYFFGIHNIYPKKFKNIGQNIFLKINIENWWFNYLKKTRPRIIFIVDITNNLPIVRAANKIGIIVCEVQHGSPDKNKLTYNFYTKKRLGTPTYFIGWGKYWKKKMSNYYKKKFFIVGKNISNKIPVCNKKNKGILIIDQLIGRETLINKAIQLREKNCQIDICYRFHPSINKTYNEIKLLKEKNIKISNPFKNKLKDDLKNVRYIIAHSSTSIYELAIQKYDICIIQSNKNKDGLMSDIKYLSNSKKIFGLINLDYKKIKKIKLFEKVNYNFLNKLI